MRAPALREDSSMSATPVIETFRIAPTHPALPGHFPGHAVVPGVVLLDQVAAAIERRFGARLAGLPQVKFLRPLLPGQDATLTLDAATGESIRFHIESDGIVFASGVATLAEASA